MFKKYIAALGLALTLGLANLASAEHGANDPYEAMCQSTGVYTDANLPFEKLSQNKGFRVLQLFGACGEKPNVLVQCNTTSLGLPDKETLHDICVWESPTKEHGPYWKMTYRKMYFVNKQGTVVEAKRQDPDDTSFVEAVIAQVGNMTVKRYCSAKVGSPIFPSAEGDIKCQRGAEDPGFLEQGYFDYLKDMKK